MIRSPVGRLNGQAVLHRGLQGHNSAFRGAASLGLSQSGSSPPSRTILLCSGDSRVPDALTKHSCDNKSSTCVLVSTWAAIYSNMFIETSEHCALPRKDALCKVHTHTRRPVCCYRYVDSLQKGIEPPHHTTPHAPRPTPTIAIPPPRPATPNFTPPYPTRSTLPGRTPRRLSPTPCRWGVPPRIRRSKSPAPQRYQVNDVSCRGSNISGLLRDYGSLTRAPRARAAATIRATRRSHRTRRPVPYEMRDVLCLCTTQMVLCWCLFARLNWHRYWMRRAVVFEGHSR